MIRLGHTAAIGAIVLAALLLCGCGAVIQYDRMQEENDRQALIRDYRECVESHAEDPAFCDHITTGLNAASLTIHQSDN